MSTIKYLIQCWIMPWGFFIKTLSKQTLQKCNVELKIKVLVNDVKICANEG
jgi:hypothetical protein